MNFLLASLVLSVPSLLLTILATLSQSLFFSLSLSLRFLFCLPLAYQCSAFVLDSSLPSPLLSHVLDISPNLSPQPSFLWPTLPYDFQGWICLLVFLGSESQFIKFPKTEAKFVLDSVFSPYGCCQYIICRFLFISTILVQALVIFYVDHCNTPLTFLLVYPLLSLKSVIVIFPKITHYAIIKLINCYCT